VIPPNHQSPESAPRFTWKLAAQILCVLAIFAFLGWQLTKNWQEVQRYHWQLRLGWAAAAVALVLIALAADIFIWNLTLGKLGGRLTFRQAAPIYMLAFVARYLPGKVASLATRLLLTERQGVSRAQALGSILTELLLRVVAALLVFAGSLPFWSQTGRLSQAYPLFILIPIGLAVLHPRVLQWLLDLSLRRLKREPVKVPFKFSDILLLLALLCLRWVGYGFGFYCLVGAVTPALQSQVITLIGMAAAVWAVGFLSVIAPGGLGLSEGLLAYLLAQYLPVGVATIIALLSRVWILVGESIWLAVALGWGGKIALGEKRQGV